MIPFPKHPVDKSMWFLKDYTLKSLTEKHKIAEKTLFWKLETIPEELYSMNKAENVKVSKWFF